MTAPIDPQRPTPTVFTIRRPFFVPLPDGRVLSFDERPLVMGILNVTPDSFAESIALVDTEAAVAAALRMEADGADIIDVGGESTRPGAEPVSADEECARVLPVVRRLAGLLRVPISVDTYKEAVARAAMDAGAQILNDVSGLRYDAAFGRVAAETGAALVLMHTRGRSARMYAEARYDDVVAEVIEELRQRVQMAVDAGVARERVIVDPGIGFAKKPVHSYGVLAHVEAFAEALGRPVLVGPSRKSFMREALGEQPAVARDWGTAAAVTAAVLGGAHIVRVHAVDAMAQVVRVAEEIRKAGLGRGAPVGTSGRDA